MERARVSLLILIYISCLHYSYSTYIATFPKVLYSGVPLTGSVYVSDATQDVTVEAELIERTGGLERVISETSTVISPGTTSKVMIPVRDELNSQSTYLVHISGSGGLTFANESVVHLGEDRLIILIQSDKNRYSAGQKVKFRAIHLLPNMLNFQGNSTTTILDGNGNKISVIGPTLVVDGVVSSSIVLSEEPVFGTWKIQVSANGIEETKPFEVFEYVLPRFTVTIELPLVNRTDSRININVIGRFTFKTDVYGSCVLQIYNEHYRHKYVNYTEQVTGSARFDIPLTDLQNALDMNSKINVRAIVTDDATFLTMVAEKEMKFAITPDPISIQIKPDQIYFVPGIDYYTAVFIGRGNSPLGTTGSMLVQVSVTTAEEKECSLNNPPSTWLDVQTVLLPEFTISFDITGYASLKIPTAMKMAERLNVELVYGSVRSNFNVEILTKSSHMFMRMAARKPCGNVGDVITIDTMSTSSINGFVKYETYSRGICIYTQLVDVQNSDRHQYQLYLTESMIPRARVIATHITSAGTIISDHITIVTQGNPCQNKVDVKLSTLKASPGDNINFTVSADPNSVVYVLAEDERNRILGTDNDVFYQEVFDRVSSVSASVENNIHNRKKRGVNLYHEHEKEADKIYTVRRSKKLETIKRHRRYIVPARQVPDSYKSSGVLLLTDARMSSGHYDDQVLSASTVLPKECVRITTPSPWDTDEMYDRLDTDAMNDRMDTDAMYGHLDTDAMFDLEPSPELSLGDIVRSRFPETWMWESFAVGNSGVKNITKTLPDSITSWVISTMATNPTTGFGIAVTKPKITVIKDFFVTIDLPQEIVKGEQVLLQVTVFNYTPTKQFMYVRILTSDGLSAPAALIVESNQGQSTFVPYTPKEVGRIEIIVEATILFSSIPADVVIKKMEVVPGGVYKIDNAQYLVDVADRNPVFKKIIDLETPYNMIKGTLITKLTITGDLMVPSIDGLQTLIRMPFGCGEQTMLNFAPAVFIAKYLRTVDKLTDAIRIQSQSAMESGYQRELGYRHNDGSFSAFGDSDPSGSTWLTAFVLKCFHQADEFLSIDNRVMSKGLAWLLRYQQPDGSFTEPGRVIHTSMQSGTFSGVKLTAYILVSVIENRNVPDVGFDVEQTIAVGINYLESRFSSIEDVYTLSLMCYALANAESSYSATCLTKLNNTASIDDGKMFWRAITSVSKRKRSLPSRAASADIEATSYSLLTYIRLGKMTEALSIVNWLVSQRNPNGGFQSTQDTIISLQALAEFSSRRPASPLDYMVAFRIVGQHFSHFYNVTPETFDVLHTVELPDTVSSVAVTAVGKGAAVIDVAMSYYVAGSKNDDTIGVNVSLTEDTVNSITVKPCISWKGNVASGMIVMVVEMPTGFQPDNDHLKTQPVIKRHETNGRNVNLYFDGMERASTVCVDVKVERRDPVVKSQACHVTVYDYYEPMHQAITRYESGMLKTSTICDICPRCGICTQGQTNRAPGKSASFWFVS